MSMYLREETAVPESTPEHHERADPEWDVSRLRSELQKRGVWVASLPSNVEHWHVSVSEHVLEGNFTFEAFVDEFASEQPFDFGKTIRHLLQPKPVHAGGWLDGEMN